MTRTRTSRRLAALLLAGLLGSCGGDEPAAAPARPASHARMVAALRDVESRTADTHYYLGDARARQLRASIEQLGDRATWRTHFDLGVAELQLGNEREGIAVLAAAHDKLRTGTLQGGSEALTEVAFWLGVGWMRLAETQNCCNAPGGRSCILPITANGVHADREGSTAAITYFVEVLERTTADDYWHDAAKWLLNLAHMTLGTFPDGVAAVHRLPAAAFAPTPGFPNFDNVAPELGLDTFSLSGSVAADDFDGDDRIDLFVSTWDTSGQLRYFHNEGDGTFVDYTERAGLAGLFGGLNLVQADYDNDGDTDLLVLRGAWLFEHGRHPNSLLRNDDGVFNDVTFDCGLGKSHYPTQTAAWADYDNDGDLDLYVGNESSEQARHPCQLFRNNGDGTFASVAGRAGVENYSFTKAVTWGDFDADGAPDIYVSNNGQPNRLYHNQGDGTFVDLAEARGVDGPLASFPAWFWDFDNDGVLDLYASCYGTGVGHLARYVGGGPRDYDLARLYRGDGSGNLIDVANQRGLDYPAMPMGSNFGDLDGDGFLDFYLGTGNVFYYSLMPNLLFMNRGGEQFENVTMASGMGHLQKGHGIAFADFDADGDLDVFEQMGGAFRGDGFRDALYENPGFGHRWLTVQLVGTTSNRSAIGARIRIDVIERGEPRSIYRHVNSGGSFGANPLRQTIGLGDAEEVRGIEVFWPTTGQTQRIEGLQPDRAIRIVEGAEHADEIASAPAPFR